MSSALQRLFTLMLLAGCNGPQGTHTLYRSSPLPDHERVHVASFDAAEGDEYNRKNCLIVRDLLAGQPGVVVRYWCEKGRPGR